MALYLIKEAPPGGALCEADGETRTPDPFITSEVLYQLSYVGATGDASDGRARAREAREDRPRHAHTHTARAQRYAGAAVSRSSSASVANSESPCFSQNAGPMPRMLSSCSTLRGVERSTSSSTAFAATVYAGLPSARS